MLINQKGITQTVLPDIQRCYFKGKTCDIGIHLHILSGIVPTFTCNTSQVKDYAGRKIEIEREERGT